MDETLHEHATVIVRLLDKVIGNVLDSVDSDLDREGEIIEKTEHVERRQHIKVDGTGENKVTNQEDSITIVAQTELSPTSVYPSQHSDNRVALCQQEDSRIAPNQQYDNIEASTQQDDTIEASTQQDNTIGVSTQQDNTIVMIETSSQQDDTIEVSSQQDNTIEASTEQDNNTIETSSQQDDNLEAPSQHDENIEASRQQYDNIEASKQQDNAMEASSQQDNTIEVSSQHNDNIEASTQQDDIIEASGQQDNNIEALCQQEDNIEASSQQEECTFISSSQQDDKFIASSQQEDIIKASSQQEDNFEASGQKDDKIVATSQHEIIEDPGQQNNSCVILKKQKLYIVDPSQQDANFVASTSSEQDDKIEATNQQDVFIVAPNQQSANIVILSQQDDNIAVHSQLNDNIIASSQQNDTIVALSQQDESIVDPGQQKHNVEGTSQKNNNILASSNKNDTNIAECNQNNTIVAPSQQDDFLTVSHLKNDPPLGTCQPKDILDASSQQICPALKQGFISTDNVDVHQQERKMGSVHFNSPVAVLYEYSVSQDAFEDDTQSLSSSNSDNSIDSSIETRTGDNDSVNHLNNPLSGIGTVKEDKPMEKVDFDTRIRSSQNIAEALPLCSNVKVNNSPCLFSSDEVEVFEKVQLEIDQSSEMISSLDDLFEGSPNKKCLGGTDIVHDYKSVETFGNTCVSNQKESLTDDIFTSSQDSSKRLPTSPLVDCQDSKRTRTERKLTESKEIDISVDSTCNKRKLIEVDSMTMPPRKAMKLDHSCDQVNDYRSEKEMAVAVFRPIDKEQTELIAFNTDSDIDSVDTDQTTAAFENASPVTEITSGVMEKIKNDNTNEPVNINKSVQKLDINTNEKLLTEIPDSSNEIDINQSGSSCCPKMLKQLVADCLETLEDNVIVDQQLYQTVVQKSNVKEAGFNACEFKMNLNKDQTEMSEMRVLDIEFNSSVKNDSDIFGAAENANIQNVSQTINQVVTVPTGHSYSEEKVDDHCVPEPGDQCLPMAYNKTVECMSHSLEHDIKRVHDTESCNEDEISGTYTNTNSKPTNSENKREHCSDNCVKIEDDNMKSKVKCSPAFITASQVLSQNSQSSQNSGSTGFVYDEAGENLTTAVFGDDSQHSLRNQIDEAHVPLQGILIEISENGLEQNSGDATKLLEKDTSHPQSISDVEKPCLTDLDEYIDTAVEALTSDNCTVPDGLDATIHSEECSIYDDERKPKLYACDADLCGDADEPLCSQVANKSAVQGRAMPVGGCFKWKYTPSCDISPESVVPDLPSEETVMRITPLKTCGKPLRLGLSKRQQVHSLHKLRKTP